MNSEDFLITTQVGSISRKVVWHGDKPIDVDLPSGWVLEKLGDKLCVRDASLGPLDLQMESAVQFAVPAPGFRQLIELPRPKKNPDSRRVDLEIVHLKQADPVYLLRHKLAPKYLSHGPKQLMMFFGQRYFMVRYRPVPPHGTESVGAAGRFSYARINNKYLLKSQANGLRIKWGDNKQAINMGQQLELDEQEFFSSTIILGINWWRFRMVPTPDSLPPVESEETEDMRRELFRFQASVGAFLCLCVALYLASPYFPVDKPQKVISAQVELKTATLIPPPPKKPDPPKRIPPPPEPKKPPEPPKVAEASKVEKRVEKPAPKKAKPVKVVKKSPAKVTPKVVKVAQAIKPPKQPPPVIPQEPPPPAPKIDYEAEARAAAKAAAEQRAAETQAKKQQLMQKLNFLSTSAKRMSANPEAYKQKEGKFTETASVGGEVSKSSHLDRMVASTPSDSKIETKSARTVSSSVNVKGKGLNSVQGKVSDQDVYGGSRKLGGLSAQATGLSISGAGEVNEAAVEQILAKYLARFQFCYEKALLSDSGIAGNVALQWTISAQGKAQNTKVLSSQINKADLHQCISKVLAEIPFPRPKGGTVTVKKTFAFTSSSL